MTERVSVERMEELFETSKNWGRWGEDDERGTLNLLNPEHTGAAARNVRGRTVSCGRILPVVPSVENPVPAHHMMILAGDARHATGVEGAEASIDYIGLSFHGLGVSHLDALCHVFHKGIMYNGFSASDVLSTGATKNSVMAAAGGIASRGVLLDIARVRGVEWLEPGEGVTPHDLMAACESEEVTVGPGDILLVSTGRDKRRETLGLWDVGHGLAGLDAECVPWLHERDIAMLGCDGANDIMPPNTNGWPLPIHVCCLVAMGVHLLDNLDLSGLAAVCAEERRWEFLFTVSPLQIVGGTGSPVNPVAVV
ncbi:MAG: cyclase family protein [Actinomycetota bacterium]|nr:cyclase family protein [Actinomycetota bacterium]